MKRCDADKIRNPQSGRCVLKSGSIGQRLLGTLKKQGTCDADKILNPESGRCVLKSGNIGQRLLGGTTPSSGWVPLTYEQIRKQAPIKSMTAQQASRIKSTDLKDLAFLRRYIFGPHLQRLTVGMASDIQGTSAYIVMGTDLAQGTWGRYVGTRLKNEKIQIGKLLVFDDGEVRLQTKEQGETVWDDFLYAHNNNTNTELSIGGGDPVYIFAATSSSEHRAPKIPRGRKAPAEHAKHHPHQAAIGLDGNVWISKKQKMTGRYVWKRATKTEKQHLRHQ